MTTHPRTTRRAAFLFSGLSLAALLGSCGSHLSGTYGKESDGAQFTFTSGDRVELNILGQLMDGTYTVEDGKLMIMTSMGVGQTFRLDGDCIDAGPALGKLCKQ